MNGGLSLSAFQELLAEKTGVPPSQQELLTGFPPAPIQLPAGAATLADLPISNGDTVVVRRREGIAAAVQQPEPSPAFAEEVPSAQQSAEQLAQVAPASGAHYCLIASELRSCTFRLISTFLS